MERSVQTMNYDLSKLIYRYANKKEDSVKFYYRSLVNSFCKYKYATSNVRYNRTTFTYDYIILKNYNCRSFEGTKRNNPSRTRLK